MSIDAMKQALEAVDWLRHHLTQHHGCLHMNETASGIPAWLDKTETALRAAIEHAERPQTHSEECWRWHHQCAVAKIERGIK